MCIVNTPERFVELLRAAADIVAQKTKLSLDQLGDTPWWHDFEDGAVTIIELANDIIGIVHLEEVEDQHGHVFLRAVEFDYDAFTHSVVMPD